MVTDKGDALTNDQSEYRKNSCGSPGIGAVEHLFMRCPVNFIQRTKAQASSLHTGQMFRVSYRVCYDFPVSVTPVVMQNKRFVRPPCLFRVR